MSERAIDLARKGFDAWRAGDFDAIEAMLDPKIKWRSHEPGDWDCQNRVDVMRTLRERYEQGFARGDLEFVEGGSDSVIVVAHPRQIGGHDWPVEVATVITFRDRRVTDMRDYPARADAIAAVGGTRH